MRFISKMRQRTRYRIGCWIMLGFVAAALFAGGTFIGWAPFLAGAGVGVAMAVGLCLFYWAMLALVDGPGDEP